MSKRLHCQSLAVLPDCRKTAFFLFLDSTFNRSIYFINC
ncbi:uncharacterized protein Dvar_64230 [Desulfosarcina variabilis str. Montpellier]